MGAGARHRRRRPARLSAVASVPPLHLVATDEVERAPGFRRKATKLLEAGGARLALHLRLRDASGAALHELASHLAPIARDAGALLIVNDRVDVALATRCSGVHLGSRSIGVADARRLVGPDLLVGASVHDPAEAREAGSAGLSVSGLLVHLELQPDRKSVV